MDLASKQSGEANARSPRDVSCFGRACREYLQQLVRKVCVNRGMVDEEVKSSVNAYVVYKDRASVDKVGTSFAVAAVAAAVVVVVTLVVDVAADKRVSLIALVVLASAAV